MITRRDILAGLAVGTSFSMAQWKEAWAQTPIADPECTPTPMREWVDDVGATTETPTILHIAIVDQPASQALAEPGVKILITDAVVEIDGMDPSLPSDDNGGIMMDATYQDYYNARVRYQDRAVWEGVLAPDVQMAAVECCSIGDATLDIVPGIDPLTGADEDNIIHMASVGSPDRDITCMVTLKVDPANDLDGE
jgi:hypothetical protein